MVNIRHYAFVKTYRTIQQSNESQWIPIFKKNHLGGQGVPGRNPDYGKRL